MKKYAIIVAAGSGLRMGSPLPKQFLLLNDKPILWYTLSTFLQAYNDLEIILVLHPDYFHQGEQIISHLDAQRVTMCAGGEHRFYSVKNGLKQIHHDSIVFVHDGVRCLLSTSLIHRCHASALENGNAIPAVPAVDSIRIVNGNSNQAIDREKIMIIQTPQTFRRDILMDGFNQDYDPSFTDEASVVERLGEKINLIEGESTNIKITRPIDLLLAEKILEGRMRVI